MYTKTRVKKISVLITKWSIIDYLFIRAILSKEPLIFELYFISLLNLIKFSNSEKMLQIINSKKIIIRCYLFFPFCSHPIELAINNNPLRKIILKYFNNKLGLRIENKCILMSSLRLNNNLKEYDEIWLSWSKITERILKFIKYLSLKNNSLAIFTPDAFIAEGYTDISQYLSKIEKNFIFLFHNKILYESFNPSIRQKKIYIELEKKSPYLSEKIHPSNNIIKIIFLAQKTKGNELEKISFQKQLDRLKKICEVIREAKHIDLITLEFRQRGGGDYEEQINQIKNFLPNIVIVRASDMPLCEQLLGAYFVISEFTSAFFYSRYFLSDECRFMYRDTSFNSYNKIYESIQNEYTFDTMRGCVLNESEILNNLRSSIKHPKITIIKV